jgi:hypothetical protein
MATANNNGKRKANVGDNAEKIISAHLDKMREFGRNTKAGSTAKQEAIELFQQDCLANVANIGMVERYANAYCEGAASNPASKAAFTSALKAFGDVNVIKAWPQISAALNKLHADKDKAVSRTTTGKDKFAQSYGLANKVKGMQGVIPAITPEWIKANVAKATKSNDELAKLARKAIADSVPAIMPAKPTKAQIEARDAFYKVFGIEMPKATA